MIKIGDTLLLAIMYLALLAPFLILFILIYRPQRIRPLLLFLLFVMVSILFLAGTPKFIGIPGARWNWTGKITSILAMLVCIRIFGFSRKESGLSFQFKKNWWIFFGLALAYYALNRYLEYKGPLPDHYSAETIAYQATMPGLEEEPWFRGLFLFTLNQYFGRPFLIGKISFGPALFLTSILFGIVHGVETNGLHVYFHFGQMTGPLISGLIWGFVTEAAGNVWPAVFLHNSSNTINYLLGVFK